MHRHSAQMAPVMLALCLLAAAFSAQPARAESAAEPPIKVKALTDYLLYFFDGRRPAERYSKDWNWFDDAGMKLGVGAYVIHRGGEAIVYDTFASVAQAKWVRNYLEKMGIKKFTVVHSHWHLDHIAGDAAYPDSDIITTTATKDQIEKQKADIASGKVWGPPPIEEPRVPNVTFENEKDIDVGDIKLELRRINIHSADSLVIRIPRDKILLAGDTLEDSLTYMVEVENLPEHVKNLKKMREWDVTTIYPNHGDPDVIMKGGYDKTFIDATRAYITRMLEKLHNPDFLSGKKEDYIGDAAAKGWVHPFEPYRAVHTQNLKLVHELLEARDEKRLLRLQRQLAAYKLLIIDELGYVPLSTTGAELLFEVFSQRYERGSTLVTSNLPFDEWTSVFGSERLTGALLDRLTHHVHILEMNGDSFRLAHSKRRSRRPKVEPSSDEPAQA